MLKLVCLFKKITKGVWKCMVSLYYVIQHSKTKLLCWYILCLFYCRQLNCVPFCRGNAELGTIGRNSEIPQACY